jgi:tetratricopeptide (TPR) repeat protein
MPKLAQLPANDGAPDHHGTVSRRMPRFRHRYFAFLSYSHKDQEIADWLHDELEEFRVPHGLAGRLTANGVIPKRLRPIFRDRHELAAAHDLGEEITTALSSSHCLIVLCSPNSAKSHWTNAEIETFKRIRPDGCLLAAIAAGEPFASDIPGREAQECFPPALRQKYDRRGRPTGKRAEPLAADLRDEGDGRRMGFLKLVAGMLGVGLDDLVQREQTRRQRRMAWVAAASLGGMAVTSGLAITAIQARDSAREQRREAEGLVAFMVGDLKDKLEPIGKLDALDGVAERVLAYYSKQDTSELSDAALLQRSRALSITAQVANARGNLDDALRLYREAAAGTAEAIRRDPDDPQRLFDHAQNVFYFADIATKRGRLDTAESAFREYKRLADQMVALDSNNMKYRMEVQYADANLGSVLYAQRRFPEAAAQYSQALRTIQAFATADPANRDFQKSAVEALAWLADAQAAEGNLEAATASRERHVALLNQALAQTGGDVSYRQKLIQAERGLGALYASRGQRDVALQHYRRAIAHSEMLIDVEQTNSNWLDFGARARLNLAELVLASGDQQEAAAQTNAGCAVYERLLARDSTVSNWRAGMRDCMVMRARLALASGAKNDALVFADKAIGLARTVKSTDREADRFALAKALRFGGDVRRQFGDMAGARTAWTAAFAALPAGVAERPAEMSEHATILGRLGRTSEAQQITTKLHTIGYQPAGIG